MKKNKPKNEIEKVVDIITQRMADQIDKEVLRSVYLESKCTNSIWDEAAAMPPLTYEKLLEIVDNLKQDFPDEFRKYELRNELKKWEFPFLYENWNIKK